MSTNKGGRPAGPKTRCSGQWTEAKYNSFIRNQLRGATRKWAPINEVKKEANVARGEYKCADCGEIVPPTIKQGRKRVQNIFVDHIDPIVDPKVGFVNWDTFIERMFCEKESLQLLCGQCHDRKSMSERSIASERRGYYKDYPREYTSYVSMKGRCNNPNKSDYEYYGGRGIKVCSHWEDSFKNFLEDMGERPEGTTLDRIDSNGNYEPSNCRWADWETQCNNKTTSVIIDYQGVCKTLSEWSEYTGISRSTIAYRLKNDFTVEESLGFEETPNKKELQKRREKNKDE